MSLDRVVTERLAVPTPWELERYKSARGFDRAEWSRLFDEAVCLRHDDATLRAHESHQRAERVRCAPAAATVAAGPRPNLFRATFRRAAVAAESDCWFDASYYNVDGVSGKVSGFVDYIDSGHWLYRSTTSQQVAVPSADAAAAGSLTAPFLGSQYYDSTRAASRFRYRHDGSGVEEMCLGVITAISGTAPGFWACTRSIQSFNEVGAGLASLSSGGRFIVGNSTAVGGTTSPIDTSYCSPSPVVGSLYLMHASYKEAIAPEWRFTLDAAAGSTLYSGASNVAPEAATDPQGTLRLGAGIPQLVIPLTARWRLFASWRRVLSITERVIARAHLKTTTGLPV